MNDCIKVQRMYDIRERTGFCSGQDLQEFFLQTLAHYSPSGAEHIDVYAAARFIAERLTVMAVHSASTVIEIMDGLTA